MHRRSPSARLLLLAFGAPGFCDPGQTSSPAKIVSLCNRVQQVGMKATTPKRCRDCSGVILWSVIMMAAWLPRERRLCRMTICRLTQRDCVSFFSHDHAQVLHRDG